MGVLYRSGRLLYSHYSVLANLKIMNLILELEDFSVSSVTVNNSHGRSMETRQRIGTRSTEENKESACEELTQCAYSKIDSVVINCNSAWQISNKSRY
jgi:hypothetical protein